MPYIKNGKPARTFSRKILKILTLLSGIILGVIILTVFGAHVYFKTEHAQKLIRDRVNDTVPGEIGWQELDIDLLKGRLTIDKPVVQGVDDKNVVVAERISADVNLLDLLKRQLVFQTVTIDQPEINLTADESGHVNIVQSLLHPASDKGKAEGDKDVFFPLNICLRVLEVNDGRIDFRRSPEGADNTEEQHAVLNKVDILVEDFDLAKRTGDAAITVGEGGLDIYGIHTELERFIFETSLENGRLDPLVFDIRTGEADVKLTGSVNRIFDNPVLDLQFEAGANLDKMQAMLGFNTDISGTLELAASIKGRPDNPEATLSAAYGGGRLADIPVAGMELESRMKDRHVTIDSLSLQLFGSRISAEGTVDLAEAFDNDVITASPDLEAIAYHFEARNTPVELAALPGVKETFSGKIGAHLIIDGRGISPQSLNDDIPGSVVQPSIEATVKADSMSYRDISAGNIKLVAEVSPAGRLEIKQLHLVNQGSGVEIEGTVDLFEPGTFSPRSDPLLDLTVAGESIFIEDFIEPFSGKLSVDGNIGGSLSDLDGNIDIVGEKLDTGVQEIKRLEIRTGLAGEKILLNSMAVTLAEDQDIRAEGWVSFDQRYEVHLSSDPIGLARINVLKDTPLADGRASVNLSGTGMLADPRLSGRIRIEPPPLIDEKEIPPFNLDLDVKDRLVRIKGEPGFDINARYRLDTHELTANACFDNTSLAPYFRYAGFSALSGRVSGAVSAQADVSALDQAEATIEISRIKIFRDQTEMISAQNLKADYGNGRLVLPESRIALLGDGTLDIAASGRGDGDITASAEGVIPSEVIAAFVPGLHESSGRIELSADVSGPLDMPRFEGTAKLIDIDLTPVDVQQNIHGLNGRIRVTNKTVNIENLAGKVGSGSFEVNGAVELRDLKPEKTDLRFTAQSLPIQVPDMLEARINAEIALKGTPDKSELTGDITLLDGLYYKDINLSLLNRAGKIGRRKRETAPTVGRSDFYDAPYLRGLSLDINLGYRNPFLVENNVLLLSLKPEFQISGTLAQPLVSGRLEADRGTVTYRNTEFEIQKGIIDFINPYRIEPTIDIKAVADVRHWVITLTVSGTPDNLNFQLSSNPPEKSADIVSLLLTGKKSGELGKDGTATRSPEEMLANLAGSRLASNVKNTTGLDTLEISYEEGETPESDGNIRVTVGKELSRRLTIEYGVEQQSGETVQKTTTIYKLLEHIAVRFSQSTDGAFGGEVQYRMEFR